MTLNELSSAIYNDIVGGALVPSSGVQFVSLEQLEDECVDIERTLCELGCCE